jgi:hypothetical protein
MNIALIGSQEVDNVWPSIAGRVVKCLEKAPSYLSAGELWQMCRSGQAFLLVAHDETKVQGAAIWQFQQSFGQLTLSCLMLTGEDLDMWADPLFQAARNIAKDGGAAALSATGRIGLVQTLKKQIPGLKIVRQTYLVEV